ncbi:MAG: S8 family serine peptidase [Thermoleophilia bacterium]|nr:S8 family serine peptidase [Thermoleophilia bacterium]
MSIRVLTAAAAAAAFALAALPGAALASPRSDDRDGDKIFDGLERRLAGRTATDVVDVIVTLRRSATAERVGELAADAGGFKTTRRFSLLDAFAAEVTKAGVFRLARLPEVAHIEADVAVHALATSAQDSFGVTKARLDSGLDGDHDGAAASYSAGDLVAAVVDTGIDAAHHDLDDGKVLAFADCYRRPCALTAPVDADGHGTHVAASIAGDGEARPDRLYRGVAPGAALVGVRVLGRDGSGTLSDVVAGLQWVVAHRATYGIEVLNLSLGAAGCASGTDAVSAAVNNAVAAGLVAVVAAGNEGPGACTIGLPAAAANAITVGAMADLGAGGFRLASFSSRGPTLDGRRKPDVLAPGVSITSAARGTATGYVTYSGTSMAAPFVAGVALLMLDAKPALSPAEVKARIMSSAVDWGAGGIDAETGAGRLDAYAAIRAAGAPISAPPAVPAHAVRKGALALGASLAFPLSVSRSAYPLAATLVAPGWTSGAQSPDFDLTLLDAAGEVVASGVTAASSQSRDLRRHEELALPGVAPGSYTLRVSAAAGAGTFFLDVSGSLASTSAPVPTAAPTIAGTPEEGSTLTVSNGVWSGATPLAFSYQWQRCDLAGAACMNIAGAGTSAYRVAAVDVGATLRAVVTATNVGGSTSAVSAATAVVSRPPDVRAPVVRALTSSGRHGRRVRLSYRVSDASGRTRERLRVFRGKRIVRTLATRLSTRVAGRTYHVLWRAPRRPIRLRFCVKAWDEAGNASARSCAPLRIR